MKNETLGERGAQLREIGISQLRPELTKRCDEATGGSTFVVLSKGVPVATLGPPPKMTRVFEDVAEAGVEG